jgi:hypothetical protein
MKKAGLLVLFLMSAAATIRAEVEIHDGEAGRETISSPAEIGLRALFRKDIPVQVGGTCAAYASIALVESACKRALGKDVNLSEGYQIYRIIRNNLDKFEHGLPFFSLREDGTVLNTAF